MPERVEPSPLDNYSAPYLRAHATSHRIVCHHTLVAPHSQHCTHIKFFCSVAMSERSSCVQVPDALEAPYQVAIVVTLFFSRAVDSPVSMVQKAVSKETSAFIPFCDVIQPCFGAMMSFSSNLIGWRELSAASWLGFLSFPLLFSTERWILLQTPKREDMYSGSVLGWMYQTRPIGLFWWVHKTRPHWWISSQ